MKNVGYSFNVSPGFMYILFSKKHKKQKNKTLILLTLFLKNNI